jgi:glycosyltransferase involved in cell wall biosynthesis
MPRIAVIIPTYNRAFLVKRAIDSVLAQTYTDYELVVVDDGSEDSTPQIVQQYTSCRYLRLEHSGLPAVARNAGVRSTDAPYVAFLDSDDEWQPQKLARQVNLISNGIAGLICSNASIASDCGTKPTLYLRANQGRTGKVLKDLIADNFVITSSVVLRRDLFDLAGGFPEDRELRGIEDYDLWLRIATATEFCYIPEELVIYRTSGPRLSQERSSIAHWHSTNLMFSRLLKTDAIHDPGIAAALRAQLDSCRRAACDEYLKQHSFGRFARSFAGFCCHRPGSALKYIAAKIVT